MAEVVLKLTEGEFILISVCIGDLYRGMIEAGVSVEGRREVSELIDKLTTESGKLYDEKEVNRGTSTQEV